jgi:hypothetical protein
MDAKRMAAVFPELGTEEEIAATLQHLASISTLNLYLKRIACIPSGYGYKEGDQGHILIRSVSDDNVVGPPIGAIDLDAESCDVLIRALLNLRKQFKVLAEYKANKKQ